GYQTLTDGAVDISPDGEYYSPGYERGQRYDDPRFAITWPVAIEVISEKDTKWAPFVAAVEKV
ncbi:MAG: dTDP-4-dehydrorhamnose 3,5-epimerase family protein, partial [Hyphomicrobiaceae bacterium]